MGRRVMLAVALAALATFVAVQAAGASQHDTQSAAAQSCDLGTRGTGDIQHVIYLQFDNTHFNRDATNVPSDLEQMPHLLNFLKSNGTLFTNDHTILISHTAGGILSSLTGLYPDRQGQTVSNSYDYYPASKVPSFTSSFKYWTAPVDPVADTLPNMITDTGKTTPAPWVPFTRAGCDVGGVGTANIELENNSTAATGDITNVFGTSSSEWNETAGEPAARPDRLRRDRDPLLAVVEERLRREQPTRSRICSRTSRAATAASTRSSARSTSIRRSRTGSRASTTRPAIRSPTPTATAASRASTGCSRRTRSATSRRCRSRASRSRTATSRTGTTCTRRSRAATRSAALRPVPASCRTCSS